MVSKSPKVPRREFTIKYKGKKVNVFAQSHSSRIGDLWGAQILCPWGCSAKIIVTGKVSPKRVEEEMNRAIKSHYSVSH